MRFPRWLCATAMGLGVSWAAERAAAADATYLPHYGVTIDLPAGWTVSEAELKPGDKLDVITNGREALFGSFMAGSASCAAAWDRSGERLRLSVSPAYLPATYYANVYMEEGEGYKAADMCADVQGGVVMVFMKFLPEIDDATLVAEAEPVLAAIVTARGPRETASATPPSYDSGSSSYDSGSSSAYGPSTTDYQPSSYSAPPAAASEPSSSESSSYSGHRSHGVRVVAFMDLLASDTGSSPMRLGGGIDLPARSAGGAYDHGAAYAASATAASTDGSFTGDVHAGLGYRLADTGWSLTGLLDVGADRTAGGSLPGPDGAPYLAQEIQLRIGGATALEGRMMLIERSSGDRDENRFSVGLATTALGSPMSIGIQHESWGDQTLTGVSIGLAL